MARRRRMSDRRGGAGTAATTGTEQVPQEALDAFMALAEAIDAGRPGAVHRLLHPMSGLALSFEGWQLEGMLAAGALDLWGLTGPGWEGGSLAEGLSISSDGERALLELSPARSWRVKDLPLSSVACMAQGEDGRWLHLWTRIGSPNEGDRLDLEAGLGASNAAVAFEGLSLDAGEDCVGMVLDWPSGRRSVLQCLTSPEHGLLGHMVHVCVSDRALSDMVHIARPLGFSRRAFASALEGPLSARADRGLGPPPGLDIALTAFGVVPPEGPWRRLEACLDAMASSAVELHARLEAEPRVGGSVVLRGDLTVGDAMVAIVGTLGLTLRPAGWAKVLDAGKVGHGQPVCPPTSLPVAGLAVGSSMALDYLREGTSTVRVLARVGERPLGWTGAEEVHREAGFCGHCEVEREARVYCVDCNAWFCKKHGWEHVIGEGHTTASVANPPAGDLPPRGR